MDKIYDRFTLESYKLAAIISMIVGDLILFSYLYIKFTNKALFDKSLSMMMTAMVTSADQLPPDFEEQLYSLMVNALITMLAFAFLYHLLVYTLWYKKNKGLARSYVAAYAWVAGPLCLLSGVLDFMGNTLPALIFIGLGLNYLFVAFGLKRFPEPRGLREKAER